MDDGFVTLTTEEMARLIELGCEIELPPVEIGDGFDGVLGEGAGAAAATEAHRRVASVEPIGTDEVQCIMVDDPDHLYLTDDLIPTHNTANIILLKSNDDAMLETLSKMSGVTHQTYTDQKAVTRDIEKLANANEGKISYTSSTKEVPVLSYNDLAFLPPRNSVVFPAGGIGDKTSASVVWNRNETALPMSWRLLGKNISKPGTDYSLQTIPTLSSAVDFDVKANQPNFSDMIMKRIEQAIYVDDAIADYKEAFGYTDDDVSRLDQDVFADQIMDIVRERIRQAHARGVYVRIDGLEGTSDDGAAQPKPGPGVSLGAVEDNVELRREQEKQQARYDDQKKPRYAGGRLSRFDLVGTGGQPSHALDDDIVAVYVDCRAYFARDREHFAVRNDGLYVRDDGVLKAAIVLHDDSRNLDMLRQAAADDRSRIYDEGGLDEAPQSSYDVTDEMYEWLCSLDSWKGLAGGRFETAMARRMQQA